jgi:hypothetical protein
VTPNIGQAFLILPGAGLIQVFTLHTRKLAQDHQRRRRSAAHRAQPVGAHRGTVTNTAAFITFIR